MKSPVTKRTVSIDGRKSGVSVEDAFWSTLKEIAHAQGATVSQMVTEIEKSRQRGELIPPRSACSYSTGSVHKNWGPPGDNGSPLVFCRQLSGGRVDG
jgi:Ribbon-helix-helix domain